MFPALLDQLQEAGTSGETVPSENLGKLMDEARRMVEEMEDRDFTPQKTAAEKERDEARKCKEMSEWHNIRPNSGQCSTTMQVDKAC